MLNSRRIFGRGQSDVTSAERSAERRGGFGDLRVSPFLQSREEESQCGWCMVSSFTSVSVSVSWSSDCLPSFDLSSLSRTLSFISFFSSDRIKLGFLCFLPRRLWIGRKLTFNYFYFWTNFIDISLCADPIHRNPFFPFWRKSQHR